jgi:ATP-dependent helicase/nuclease subunit B
LFDNRSGGGKSDQFAYSLNQDGSLGKRASDAMTAGDFFAFLDAAKQKITDLGQAVYAGCADVSPYRKGSATACDHCRLGAICRIDPWTHEYRSLSRQS